MPGRKSNLSTVTNGDEESPAPPGRASREGSSVEDLALPRTMISRLAKGVLPPNTSIHKDALLALSKSCTVFVNFLASNSNEYAQIAGKKTIQPADVIAALKENEFEHFIPRLEAELKKYNTVQCDKRNSYRRKIREEKASSKPPGAIDLDDDVKPTDSGAENGDHDADASMLDATDMSVVNGNTRNGDDEPPSKKLRREDGDEEEDEEVEDEEEFHDALEGEDEEVVEEDEEEGDEEGEEEQVDEEEEERVGDGMRDEALDDASEDSD
ncbi:histone-fold-containing protein [Aureobasidium pullulans]|uniref:DNA polymerase epsilon subunit D n=1 Tax=Aureobasidium pullulans TaxID=5580 RepID=A0AB74JLC2_AURPU|nr:histone-fold-containing protein [Aureobasidium pullulans]